MGTLEEQHQSTTTTTPLDRLAMKTMISLPTEIINDIITRLPVKSILRLRSVSKPWLSFISDPSFTKLYYTRATVSHRTALFISAYDQFTRNHHFLSAAHDSGTITHLMTLNLMTLGNPYFSDISEVEAEGLIFFTCTAWVSGNRRAHAFVLNPSTRKSFKLPDPTNITSGSVHGCYLFGFDEVENKHKILHIRKVLKPKTIEFMMFCMSNYSWTKIDLELPIGFSSDRLTCNMDGGVCVNSVVHVMVQDLSCDILTFDFTTEKLSIISVPQGVVPRQVATIYYRNVQRVIKDTKPFVMKINGCVGVVCHDRADEIKEIHIWMLQDYETRVWVKETIKLQESLIELGGCFPLPKDVNMEDEIIFSSSKAYENVLNLPIYNMSGCFNMLRFTLDHKFLCSKSVKFNNIMCYVESIMPV